MIVQSETIYARFVVTVYRSTLRSVQPYTVTVWDDRAGKYIFEAFASDVSFARSMGAEIAGIIA